MNPGISQGVTAVAGWELSTMERRYSVPPAPAHHRSSTALAPPLEHSAPRSHTHSHTPSHTRTHSTVAAPSHSEDLHAWSIYRQNLNSDFTDSALGSSEKSPLPYGNFQLRDSTVQSILSHPRYGPKSALGSNMYTYLKFGLPRVFPPSRGPRDGSSGYDSSDDNGSPAPRASALRARSDPDFRSHLVTHQPPVTGPQHRPYSGGGQGGGGGGGWRAKSCSEANLDTLYRRSVHDLRGVAEVEHTGMPGRRGSHASLALSRRSHPHLGHVDDKPAMSEHGGAPMLAAGNYYPALAEHGLDTSPFAYPHLQVRGLEVESRQSRRHLLLQDISLEVRGGEILAVMATSADEGTVLLNALAGCHSRLAGRVHGDILLNGQIVRPSSLRKRTAYVRCDRALNPDLSVEQTLHFTYWLKQPGHQGGKAGTKDRIAALVEDLGLEQVRHTKVWSLTTSERRRLAVAAQLLLDTDILVLDRPTAGMDIFDTFFLVEFLRQWAGNGGSPVTPGMSGRIVIMTLHPPTYEIFTMVSRVALLSTGRLMFCGRRRRMLPYFANAEYPCPAYKNPSDYYLDLVTLDDLSAEAMLESSQRIEQLADVFRRKEEPLSDPGPPAGLPPSVKSSNIFKKATALLVCRLIYSQPAALSRWLSHLILAVLLSLCLGVVWWDVVSTDPQLLLGDRIGFLYASLVVVPWPLWLLMGPDTRWQAVASDIVDSLYGPLVYIFCQVVYGALPSALVWLAYILPAHAMAGLNNQANAFYYYSGMCLLYLMSVQALISALTVVLRSRRGAALLTGAVLAPLSLVAGGLLHEKDLSNVFMYIGLASPAHWTLPVLVRKEYAPDVVAAAVANIMCRNKQVQHQDIIVQLPCPPPNVTAALQYHGLATDSASIEFLGTNTWPLLWPPVALACLWAFSVLLTCIAFPFAVTRPRKHPAPNYRP